MKRLLLPPIAVLCALLALSLWNSSHMERQTRRWRAQLQETDRLAQSECWAEALDSLWESYDDWTLRQTYLHIVSHHDAVDDAEAMYRRAMAFAETQEITEFRAELGNGSAEYQECAIAYFSARSLFSSAIKVSISLNCR